MKILGINISSGKNTGEVYLPITWKMLAEHEDGIDALARRAERLLNEPSELPGLLDVSLVGEPARIRIRFDKDQTDSAAVTSWAFRKGLAEKA